MIREINHIGLFTKDMQASRRFYEEILGGIVIREFINDKGQSQYMYLQLARSVIELILVTPDAANTGYAHIAFLIDRVHTLDEDYKNLVEQGYSFTLKPKTASSGDGRLAFFLEDSGCSFELIDREENIRIRDHRSDKLAAFRWFGICAPQEKLDKSGVFYEKVLGLNPFAKNQDGIVRYGLEEDAIALLPSDGKEDKALSYICLEVYDGELIKKTLLETGYACSATREYHGECYFEATGPQQERVLFVQKNGEVE